MAEKKSFEKRTSSRKRLSGLLPGKLIDDSTHKIVSCKPIDLNSSGLGLIISERFSVGHVFTLDSGTSSVKLKVVWIQRDFGKNDLFRYGLITLDTDVDLVEIFTKAGCLK